MGGAQVAEQRMKTEACKDQEWGPSELRQAYTQPGAAHMCLSEGMNTEACEDQDCCPSDIVKRTCDLERSTCN